MALLESGRLYIDALADQITSPFAGDWMPAFLKPYDGITRDKYLRSAGVSEAALRMMSLGSTPVARFRSFLDVLHEVAVNREFRRRADADSEQLLKIDDRLPHAFAARLSDRLRYECAVLRIEHDAKGARVFFSKGGSNHSVQAGYVMCAIPFSTLRSVEFSPMMAGLLAEQPDKPIALMVTPPPVRNLYTNYSQHRRVARKSERLPLLQLCRASRCLVASFALEHVDRSTPE